MESMETIPNEICTYTYMAHTEDSVARNKAIYMRWLWEMKQRHRKSDVHGREAQIRLIANMSMTADSLPQSGYTVGE